MSRVQARMPLFDAGKPIPLDNPGQVYAFKVTYKYDKTLARTIEAKAEDVLGDLLGRGRG